MSKLNNIKDKAKDLGGKVSDKAEDIGSSIKDKLKETYGDLTEKVGENIGKFGPFKGLEMDAKLGRTLHSDCIAALNIIQEKKNIKELLEKAYGFAVIPSVGRASLVLGGAYGLGEVFEKDHVIGYAAIIKFDIGVQLGGTTFHEIIIFNDEEAWKQFKGGKYSFEAEAGVAFVKAGAQASKGFGGNTIIFVYNEGGELLDLSIGVQKFIFRTSGLGGVRKIDVDTDIEDK